MLLFLLACVHDIHPEYDAARAEALTIATDRPAQWSPDLSIAVANVDFERVLDASLTSALSSEVKGIGSDTLGLSLSPRFSVDEAKIRPVADCAACLGFKIKATSTATASIAGFSQSLPVSLTVGGVLTVEVRDGKYILVKPKRVNKVGVEIAGLGVLGASPSKTLQDLLERQLSDQIPTVQVLALDTDTFPVRDLRIRTTETAVVIDALTNVPNAAPLSDVGPPGSGLRLSLSESALTGLARRAAYEAGTFSYDTAVDPQKITLDGNTFTMSLRVWRLTGAGWWRDYEIKGHLVIEGTKVKLKPDDVKEVGQSQGAALVDPLAAIFEGKILSTIEDGIDRSLPGKAAQDVGKVRIAAAVSTVTAIDHSLVVDALLKVDSQGVAPLGIQGSGQNR